MIGSAAIVIAWIELFGGTVYDLTIVIYAVARVVVLLVFHAVPL
jgi:hypothetical protein